MNTSVTKQVEYLPRSRRRLLVAIALIGYPVAAALLAGLKHTSLNRWLILAIFFVVLLPTAATLLVGYRYARGRIEGRHVRLDERDLALRQQAYALSHRVLAVFLVVANIIAIVYLTAGHTLRFDTNTFWPVSAWVIVYIPALPSLMLTWIETDQPADA